MESIEQNIKNKPENKESDFFQKLERIIPKNIAYLVAGISLLLAVEEASGQEKPIFSEKIKPTNQQERILNQNEETLFNEKFNFSVQPKIKRFIITERDAEERRGMKNILNDPLDSLFNFCSSFSSKSDIKDKREIGFYTLVKGVSIDGPQKFLDQYKIEHKDINFKIDSLETRRTLDKEDYKKIFTGFFQEEELKLILDCVSVVQIIDSPEEERKIPGRYGIEGERAAHFKRGENKIEFQKHYLDECDNEKKEAETAFHEFGHAFDPLSSFGKEGVVALKLKEIGLPPWVEIMKKDQIVKGDTLDTFFDYPKKIANAEIRESEDFAESFSNYFWHPLWLQENAPNRFKIIDALIKTYLKSPNFNIYERSNSASQYLEKRYSNEETKLKEKINEIIRNF